MTPVTTVRPARKRIRVRRRRPSLIVRFWWIGLPLLFVALLAVVFSSQIPTTKHPQPLYGYLTQTSSFDEEYRHFNGKPLKDPELRKEFEKAASLASAGEYNGALLLLETLSKKAALPVVFNNMGVLYTQLNDRASAVRAFRDALARDLEYGPVRRNVERLKGLSPNMADPVSSEIEPNNNIENANVIALNKPVQAEISDLDNDVDVFKVTSPRPPRDLLMIHIENHSRTLAPHLSIYDEDGVILPYGKDEKQPGASLTQYLAPKPNTSLYLAVSGLGSSSGTYTLTVQPQKMFDAQEPNDDIYSASKLTIGQRVEANIMDESDTDFYAFTAPRTGSVSIDVGGVSSSLIPALSTFGSDMRIIGFGPDVRKPGTPLHHTMAVEEGATYYVQVWSQGKSSGTYTLRVE
jgi:hypothetical protein